MANLSQIAKVVISLATGTVSKASFGIGMVVSATTAFSDRVRIYSNYDAAVSDNLDSKTLQAIGSYFGQTPTPQTVMVGRRDVIEATLSVTLQTISPGNIFAVLIDGSRFEYTAEANDTVTEVYAGLVAAINADAQVAAKYNVNVQGSAVQITPKDPTVSSVIVPANNTTVIAEGDATNVARDLVAINRANKAFYGFMLTERGDNLILQASIWAETQAKLFFAASASAAIWDTETTTDIASTLKLGQYFRTVLLADRAAATQYAEAAWMGRVFTIEPGGEVWALKVLSTITPSNFSDTEQAAIWSKNANTYEAYSDNVYLTNPGKVSAGEWVDIIRGRDWLVDDLQKEVVSAKIRAKKIPYTNPGIQTLVNVVRGRLVNAQKKGVLAPDEVNGDGETVPGFQISYPNAADVSASTKATRILYLSFVGILAGAIQVTDLTGSLAYDYEGAE